MAISKDKVKKATAAASYFSDPEPAGNPQPAEDPRPKVAEIQNTAAGAQGQGQAQEPVKKSRGGKVLTTFFIDPEALEDAQLIASFRSITQRKNISQGTIMREALEAYLEDHRDEIEGYKQIAAQMEKK